jgi:spore germination cell wall hydrolase CwlJ-like protein
MTPREIARALSDIDVLALTLHHEAGAERLIGLIAVASVIRNRVAWGRWGKTVTDVCLAGATNRRGVLITQFSCWIPEGGPINHKRLIENADAIRAGKRPTTMRRAYDVAEAVLEDGLPDPTGRADHYYAPLAMVPVNRVPDWAQGKEPSAVLGAHRFYRLRTT